MLYEEASHGIDDEENQGYDCPVCNEPETEEKGKCSYYCEKCGDMVHGECIAHCEDVDQDRCKNCCIYDIDTSEWVVRKE